MGKADNYSTDFLFSEAGFMMGFGSVLSLDGSYFKYNTPSSGEEADAAAIRADWDVVGQDIQVAIAGVKNTDGSKSR